MVENQGDKEEKFDFDSAGEALGYISMEQARLLAMRTAGDNPGNYGRRFQGMRMVFDAVEEEDGEDYYVVTLSFRPEGNFSGKPGVEQFFIEKEGTIVRRQVRGLPTQGGWRRFGVVPIGVGVVAVAVAAVIGVALASGGGPDEPVTPTAVVIPTKTPAATPATTTGPTEAPAAVPIGPPPTPTGLAGFTTATTLSQRESPLISRFTPVATPAPAAPSATPFELGGFTTGATLSQRDIPPINRFTPTPTRAVRRPPRIVTPEIQRTIPTLVPTPPPSLVLVDSLPASGRIAYQSNDTEKWQVYVANANGTGFMQVTNHPNGNTKPVWSPSGGRIVYESSRRNSQGSFETGLYLANADGSGEILLAANGGIDGSHVWSPDGQKIAYAVSWTSNRNIHVIPAVGVGEFHFPFSPG